MPHTAATILNYGSTWWWPISAPQLSVTTHTLQAIGRDAPLHPCSISFSASGQSVANCAVPATPQWYKAAIFDYFQKTHDRSCLHLPLLNETIISQRMILIWNLQHRLSHNARPYTYNFSLISNDWHHIQSCL